MIITGFAIVTLASIGCAFARSVEVLWTFRALQGLAAGMFVVGRAVVRDVYEGPAAQRVISQVSVLFAIAPAIAPVLGGYLHQWFGWRSVFLFMALFAGAVSLWSWCSMPETLPPDRRHSLHAGRLARAYGASLSHPGFVACALATAFAFMAIFLYIADANALLVRHLHLPETAFFWLFGPVTAGMMLGGWLSGKVAGKMDSTHTIGWSFAGMIVATGANVTFHVLHPAALPWTVIPLFFYATGMALSMPTLTLLGLDYFPARRGLASSCQAFVLTAGNALTAGLLAPFAATSPLRLSLVSAALMLIAFCCLPFIRRGKIGTE